MMDHTREKTSHKSKFVKQLYYYTIVASLQMRSVSTYIGKKYKLIDLIFSLTVVTLVMTGAARETITMIDTAGYSHDLTSSTIFATLGIGWAAFGLSLIFNILYYALHPSQVSYSAVSAVLFKISIFLLKVDLLNIREKLVVAVVGYEINLVEFKIKGIHFNRIFLENLRK